MAKTVEINVKIDTKNGVKSIGDLNSKVKTSLNTISDMEDAVGLLRDKLKGLEVGSEEFNNLQREILKVDSALQNANKSIAGLDAEGKAGEMGKLAGGIGAVGSAIALSFAGNEDVEEFFKVFAQGLAITNAAKGGIEAFTAANKLYNASVLKNTIATAAQAVATNTATTAQKTLNLVVKASPLFLMAGVILGVAAALGAFSSSNKKAKIEAEQTAEAIRREEEAVNKLKEETAREREEVGKAISEFGNYLIALRATNAGSEERAKLIDTINGKFGTTLKNLKDETLFQNQLNVAISEYISNLKTKILLTANEERITEELLKQIELEEKLEEIKGRIKAEQDKSPYGEFTVLGEEFAADLAMIDLLNKQIKEVDASLTALGEKSLKLGFVDDKKDEKKEDKKDEKKEDEDEDVTIGVKLEPILEFEGTKSFIQPFLEWEEKKALEWQEKNGPIKIDVEPEMDEQVFDDIIPEPYVFKSKFDEMVTIFKESWTMGFEFFQQNFKDKIQTALDITSFTLTEGMDLLMNQLDAKADERRRKNEQAYLAETELYKSQLANREISQKEYDMRVALQEQKKKELEKSEQRKAFNRNKANTMVDISMKLAQALMGIQLNAAANPANAITFGAAGLSQASILSAITAAFTATQLGLVASQKFQAARGGQVPGQPSMVDSVPSLLAPGEMVINSNSSRMFGGLLSQINMAGGGISLAPNISVGSKSFTPVFEQNTGTQTVEAIMSYDRFDKDYKQGNRMRERGKYSNKK